MKILQFNKRNTAISTSNQNSPFCQLYNTFVYQEHVCIVMELLEGSLYNYYYDSNNYKPMEIDKALEIIVFIYSFSFLSYHFFLLYFYFIIFIYIIIRLQ